MTIRLLLFLVFCRTYYETLCSEILQTSGICEKNCTYPKRFGNGTYIYPDEDFFNSTQGFAFLPCGAQIVPMCKDGFTLKTPWMNITCLSNGSLDHLETPVCESVICQHPENVSYGYYILLQQGYEIAMMDNEYTYGSKVASQCVPGYEIKSGPTIRTCQEDGTWSGDEPVCSKLECPFPFNVVGVNPVGVTAIKFNETAEVTCTEGYKYIKGSTKCMCTQCGSLFWGGLPPVCEKEVYWIWIIGACVAFGFALIIVCCACVLCRKGRIKKQEEEQIKERRGSSDNLSNLSETGPANMASSGHDIIVNTGHENPDQNQDRDENIQVAGEDGAITTHALVKAPDSPMAGYETRINVSSNFDAQQSTSTSEPVNSNTRGAQIPSRSESYLIPVTVNRTYESALSYEFVK